MKISKNIFFNALLLIIFLGMIFISNPSPYLSKTMVNIFLVFLILAIILQLTYSIINIIKLKKKNISFIKNIFEFSISLIIILISIIFINEFTQTSPDFEGIFFVLSFVIFAIFTSIAILIKVRKMYNKIKSEGGLKKSIKKNYVESNGYKKMIYLVILLYLAILPLNLIAMFFLSINIDLTEIGFLPVMTLQVFVFISSIVYTAKNKKWAFALPGIDILFQFIYFVLFAETKLFPIYFYGDFIPAGVLIYILSLILAGSSLLINLPIIII